MGHHFGMARFCARVTAHGRQASARPRRPKRIPQLPATVQTATTDQPALAPAVACLSQLTGLGQTGAGGESAARVVGEEGGGLGLASASRPQPGGSRVAGQQLRERPVL